MFTSKMYKVAEKRLRGKMKSVCKIRLILIDIIVFDSISPLKEKRSFQDVSRRLISSDSIFAGWFSAL